MIDTHGRADDISSGLSLAAETGASYYLHPYDAIHPIDVQPVTFPFAFIHDCQVFPVGRHELKALHIPGHTLGLVAFRLDDRDLFTGDSIFIRSIARRTSAGRPNLKVIDYLACSLHTRAHDGDTSMARNFDVCSLQRAAGLCSCDMLSRKIHSE